MTLQHFFLASLLLALVASISSASTLVIRDSIGPDSGLTDGMPGGATFHDGGAWNTLGLTVNSPDDGKLTQARFVVFAKDQLEQPENDLADIYGYPIEFHIWTDGIEGGADSFDENPQGVAAPGHLDLHVNSQTASYISVSAIGHTGPIDNPNKFTTYLVTIDLSSFNVVLDAGAEYVMGLIQDNETNFITGGGFFQISGSRATGFEDVYRGSITDPAIRPGYLSSQHSAPFEQYAGSFTLTPVTPGDYDFDGDVDTFDYDKWRDTFGSTTNLMADGNDDNEVNAADYVVWRKYVSLMGVGTSASRGPPVVPEPNAAALAFLALLPILRRPRR